MAKSIYIESPAASVSEDVEEEGMEKHWQGRTGLCLPRHLPTLLPHLCTPPIPSILLLLPVFLLLALLSHMLPDVSSPHCDDGDEMEEDIRSTRKKRKLWSRKTMIEQCEFYKQSSQTVKSNTVVGPLYNPIVYYVWERHSFCFYNDSVSYLRQFWLELIPMGWVNQEGRDKRFNLTQYYLYFKSIPATSMINHASTSAMVRKRRGRQAMKRERKRRQWNEKEKEEMGIEAMKQKRKRRGRDHKGKQWIWMKRERKRRGRDSKSKKLNEKRKKTNRSAAARQSNETRKKLNTKRNPSIALCCELTVTLSAAYRLPTSMPCRLVFLCRLIPACRAVCFFMPWQPYCWHYRLLVFFTVCFVNFVRFFFYVRCQTRTFSLCLVRAQELPGFWHSAPLWLLWDAPEIDRENESI